MIKFIKYFKKKIKITYSVEKSLNVLKTLEDKSFSLKTLLVKTPSHAFQVRLCLTVILKNISNT